MKKLLVLALSAMLVLSVAAVSMAAVTVSGEVVMKYQFNAGEDATEGKVVFDGKVNDAVTTKVVAKYDSVGGDFFVDEYWFNVAGDMGELKVGNFGFGTNGSRDIVSNVVGDLKAECGIQYTYKADALTFKAFIALDQNGPDSATTETGDLALDDNGIGISLAYDAETFGVEAIVVDTAYENEDTAWILNAYVKPMDSLKAYLHTGIDEEEYEITTIGALYTGMDGALSIRGEFGMGDNNEDEWGFAVEYAASNSLKYKYQRVEDNDTITTSEFKVTCAF